MPKISRNQSLKLWDTVSNTGIAGRPEMTVVPVVVCMRSMLGACLASASQAIEHRGGGVRRG